MRFPRLLVFGLLAWVLCLRALVPAGWMPSANGGFLSIELCPGAARVAAHADHAMAGKHHAPAHRGEHDDCAFAPISTAAANIDVAPGILVPAIAADARTDAAPAPFFATGPPAPPPPSTGPPAFA